MMWPCTLLPAFTTLYILVVCIAVVEKSLGNAISGENGCNEMFSKKEAKYKQQIDNLMEQLKALKKELDDRQKEYDIGRRSIRNRQIDFDSSTENSIWYNRFDSNFVYGSVPDGHDNEEPRTNLDKRGGLYRQEIKQVIKESLEMLRNGTQNETLKFFDGIYRHEPTQGTRYKLTFSAVENPRKMVTIDLYRPYSSLKVIKQESKVFQNTTINVIVPLSNKIQRFRAFLDNFASIIQNDRRVHLTVVYFGQDDLQQVRGAITYISKKFHYKKVLLLTLNETFSRSRAIQVGIEYWNKSDALVFTCDVDVLFNNDFLNRCRVNTCPGKSVYFPIVFSQYNPAIIQNFTGMRVRENEIRMNRNFGFWREFGYGMNCIYRSDFLRLGGIDYESSVWGGEDVYLYKKFTRSNLTVVRSADPGIMHVWHEKKCDKSVLGNQYISCVNTKVKNEGSHIQIGRILFGLK